MGTFNILSTYVTCEYATELPFNITDNSSLLSHNCSFIAYAHLDGIFQDPKHFVCTIKGSKLSIRSGLLPSIKAENLMISIANDIIGSIDYLLTLPTSSHFKYILSEKVTIGEFKHSKWNHNFSSQVL